MKQRIFILLTACVLLCGCYKDVAIRTNYILRPEVQPVSSVDPYEPFEGLVAYSYLLDTTYWGIASYEEALAGTLTAKNDPTHKVTAPEATSVPFEGEGALGWISLTLESPLQMVVAVDTAHKIYAYTQLELVENVFDLYVVLPFQPWRESFSYKIGKWSYYNNFYVPRPKHKCTIVAKTQTKEEGPEVDAAQIRAYAYAADTTEWYIASYDDAYNYKLTKKESTLTRNQPNYNASKESAGVYSMTVTLSPLMVVVVDPDNKIYAYSKKVIDLEGGDVTFPTIVFRPWSTSWKQDQQGWQVINGKNKPKTPVTPSQR